MPQDRPAAQRGGAIDTIETHRLRVSGVAGLHGEISVIGALQRAIGAVGPRPA